MQVKKELLRDECAGVLKLTVLIKLIQNYLTVCITAVRNFYKNLVVSV